MYMAIARAICMYRVKETHGCDRLVTAERARAILRVFYDLCDLPYHPLYTGYRERACVL